MCEEALRGFSADKILDRCSVINSSQDEWQRLCAYTVKLLKNAPGVY